MDFRHLRFDCEARPRLSVTPPPGKLVHPPSLRQAAASGRRFVTTPAAWLAWLGLVVLALALLGRSPGIASPDGPPASCRPEAKNAKGGTTPWPTAARDLDLLDAQFARVREAVAFHRGRADLDALARLHRREGGRR
jgi:hypothetical protein